MKYGARNRVTAKVSSVQKGDVMSLAKFDVQSPAKLASVLTTESLEELDLKAGDTVELVIRPCTCWRSSRRRVAHQSGKTTTKPDWAPAFAGATYHPSKWVPATLPPRKRGAGTTVGIRWSALSRDDDR